MIVTLHCSVSEVIEQIDGWILGAHVGERAWWPLADRAVLTAATAAASRQWPIVATAIAYRRLFGAHVDSSADVTQLYIGTIW